MRDFRSNDALGRCALIPVVQRRPTVSHDDFLLYWREVHGLVVASQPGIFQYRQIGFDHDSGGIWPSHEGISREMPPGFPMDGIAELVFKDNAGLQTFAASVGPFADIDDGICFGKECCYVVAEGNIETLKSLVVADDTPASNNKLLRLMVFIRRRDGVSDGDFRFYIRNQWALELTKSPATAKIRVILLEALTPETSKNIDKNISDDEEYSAIVEIVFHDTLEAQKLFDSALYQATVEQFIAHVEKMNVLRVHGRYRYVDDGERTLVGRLGPTRAKVVHKLGAKHIIDGPTWL